ncbi:MAG: stage II sporulation protein P [Oscillospiraceae bacterium]|nr:stage II sporulation protein P [Oscillospiraceae bacterium]
MSLKKGFAAAVMIFAGIYAVHSVTINPQTRELMKRFLEENKLSTAGLRLELGLDDIFNQNENVETIDEQTSKGGQTAITATEASLAPFPSEVLVPETAQPEPEESPVILPTTIEGGMVITNNTSYKLDLNSLIAAGTTVKLASEGPQVLIIHTHGSEAYTSSSEDNYLPTDNYRTEDSKYSVIRVGDELAASYQSYGISVIHDRNIYDFPSYTGSYARSEEAIEKYLEQYPGISIVVDLHRDSIGDGDVVYKTVAEGSGKPSSQLMLLVGTGENGLEHPNWQENLKFALYLQSAVVSKYPSLARPIALKKERYNQHLTTGSIILEVGSNGNTLSEALNAVRLFADATAPALKELG